MKRATRKSITILAGLTFIGLIVAAAIAWRSQAVADADPPSTRESRSADKSTGATSVPARHPMSGTDNSNTPAQLPQSINQPAVSKNEPLPPDGTPWGQVFAALINRAQTGDKAASDRLYDDTFGCIQYAIVLGSARERLRIKSDVSEMSVGQIIRELDSYDTMQSVLRENAATCSNVSRDEVLREMYSILLAAARNGNERAAACYASGPYGRPPVATVDDSETALAKWADNALEFMHAGVRLGDWRMVYLLQTYFNPATRMFATSYDPMWEAHQFRPDPELAYRYAELWAIGARIDGSDGDQVRASGILADFKQRFEFSDMQIRDAEQWAQHTYRQYFAGKPWTIGGDTISWCNHGK